MAPNATILGEVSLGEVSYVGYGSVVRGDVNAIKIGNNSVIGDRVTIHAARDGFRNTGVSTQIGDNTYIGSGCLIHAATIEDKATVLPGSSVLDGAVVSSESVLGPASLLLGGTRIPPGEYWEGSPAKFSRPLTVEEKEEAQKLRVDAQELASR